MMITAILCTARKEPKYSWMADSLVHNLNACARSFPEVGFELIVVDKLLWGEAISERRHYLENAINKRFSYRHVTPKPSPWQGPWRKTKRDYYDLCGARNTGIALARGSHIVLFDDCSVLDENWLLGHVRGAKRKLTVAGSFRSYNHAKVVDGRVVDGDLHPCGVDSRGDAMLPAPGGWLYGLNCSFPLEAALQVNGYDEMFSGQGGSEDSDFGVRVQRNSSKCVYLPDSKIYQILETHEAVCEFSGWGNPQPKPQKELMLRDGKAHFANERLIQDLFDEPSRVWTRGNDFDLKELRREALATGQFPAKRALTHDWRDGQPLEDMD